MIVAALLATVPLLAMHAKQTVTLPGSALLCGEDRELHVVTPRGSWRRSPPSDERYNRRYFIEPSMTAGADTVV